LVPSAFVKRGVSSLVLRPQIYIVLTADDKGEKLAVHGMGNCTEEEILGENMPYCSLMCHLAMD
jgi:hypothetical protein